MEKIIKKSSDRLVIATIIFGAISIIAIIIMTTITGSYSDLLYADTFLAKNKILGSISVISMCLFLLCVFCFIILNGKSTMLIIRHDWSYKTTLKIMAAICSLLLVDGFASFFNMKDNIISWLILIVSYLITYYIQIYYYKLRIAVVKQADEK